MVLHFTFKITRKIAPDLQKPKSDRESALCFLLHCVLSLRKLRLHATFSAAVATIEWSNVTFDQVATE